MAASDHSQIWLTSVLSDNDVAGALTLCFSLKRSLTSRKVGVIVSKNVSLSLGKVLRHGFDLFLHLEEELNTAEIKNVDFAMLFALTLKSFRKCVFLAPTMFAVKNSDELFDSSDDGAFGPFVFTEKEENIPIIVVRPSLHIFEVLMEGLKYRNGKSVEYYLRNWTENQTQHETKYLQRNYHHCISSENEDILGNLSDFSIINVVGIPLDVDPKTFGLYAQVVLEQRKQTFSSDVQPLLQSTKARKLLTTANGFFQRNPNMNEPVAIIGMSCRYPKANNLEEFWSLLVNGEDGTGKVPDFRWLRENTAKNIADCRKINAGFLNYPAEDFDSKFFGISPKEMQFLDPQHRLLHELVWEALEDASVNPNKLRETRGGVFVGAWTNEYKDILNDAGCDDFYRMYMGNSIGAAAARISHLLELTGPSISTESGCSSAMVAVHLACKSLQRGESSFALACGVNLLLAPFDKDIMSMVLSPDGHCKTFDAKANGFARAEGCGVLALKRLSDAVRDGDNIWALIRGSGITQEGISKSIGTPTIFCESMAMKLALADAHLQPQEVSYVETHGTGTPVGDPMEIAAIAKAYHSKYREEPLLIGSVKTNIGHTESCSGITGIMKVVLAMQNEIIPAHRNLETLNPAIDLNAVPAQIPIKAVPWIRQKGKARCAGVSSFGITGTDAHAIIEESPLLPPNYLALASTYAMDRPLHIMKVCARTDEDLQRLLESYKNHFKFSRDDFKDLAFTANVGRTDFYHRAIIIANSNENAIKCVENQRLLSGEESTEDIGKICFLFTGQGSQYPNMARQLYQTSHVFKMHFDHCDKILKNNYNIEITQVLWPADGPASNEMSRTMSRTIFSQPSIFCVEYGLLKLWESWGVKPDYVLGHSLGEFAAAVAAGLLQLEDALKLVAERSFLIDPLPRGKMLVIKADMQRVDSLLKNFTVDKPIRLDFAALNSTEQTVVAGDSDLVLHFSEYCKESNLKCIILEATHAFHSRHMDSMLNDYRQVVNTVKLHSGNNAIKFISGMRGIVIERMDAEYWVQHTRESVMFMKASKNAVDLGCKTFIEIGPQPILAALTMINNDCPLLCLPSLKRSESEWETLFNTLGKLYVKGLEIDWEGMDKLHGRKKCKLPSYPFNRKKYWPDTCAITGVAIHPLLGSVISNPSHTRLFQSRFSSKTLEWVKDHSIGDNVIFPGAGYLEMCIVAGLATMQGATTVLSPAARSMKIENLLIEAPLSIQENKVCQVQTVVEFNTSKDGQENWNDIKISIFQNFESEPIKWLLHARATFSPTPSREDAEVQTDMNEKILMETVKLPTNDEEIGEVYNKLAFLGLKFGPVFRSIEKIWRFSTGNLLAKLKVPSEDTQIPYMIHPVILDAMIQAIMMFCTDTTSKKTLHVPIKIGKFVWLNNLKPSDHLYIHCYAGKDEKNCTVPKATAVLLDCKSTPIAKISNIELVDTTVKAIESVLDQQTSTMPDMFEEVWKQKLGPRQYCMDMEKANGIFYSDEFKETFEGLNQNPPSHIKDTLLELDNFVYLNMLRGFYECGWKPVTHQPFTETLFRNELCIVEKHNEYFGFVLDVFEQEGILRRICSSNTETKLEIIKAPPTLKEVLLALSSSVVGSLTSKFRSTLLFAKIGEDLGAILKGEQSALGILFPSEQTDHPSAGDFYTEYAEVFEGAVIVSEASSQSLIITKKIMNDEQHILRILEVGAGTGFLAQTILKVLAHQKIKFEYTYTDISAAFFPAAENKFNDFSKHIIFKKLNLEEDPLDQGFIPEYFDYVVNANVIHATKDIRQTLLNIRTLMKPHGQLHIQEMTRVLRLETFAFGLLEDFWRFEDRELRPKHCTLTKPSWKKVLNETGFQVNGMFSTNQDSHSYICCERMTDSLSCYSYSRIQSPNCKIWLIFHSESHKVSSYINEKIRKATTRQAILVTDGDKFRQYTEGDQLCFTIRRKYEEDFVELFQSMERRKLVIEGVFYCWALDKNKISQDDVLQPYFFTSKAILNCKQINVPRIYAVISGVTPIENNDTSHFHTSTIWGFSKSMSNEHHGVNGRCIEVTDGRWDQNRLEEVFSEIWLLDQDSMAVFQGNKRLTPRLQPHKPINNSLLLPKGLDRFQLILPESKAVSDLRFGPLDACDLKDYEVEVQIKASALNFRDVLSIIKPSDDFKNVNTVGFDFSGVVKRIGRAVNKWKIEDRVFGCNVHFTAMPSHLVLNECLLLPLKDDMSFSEAATIPAVYITSMLCLIEVAKVRKEDVVLIHAATGGVGLSAIEICKHVGCTIIATAGSKRKQNYLRSLEIQHIFNSRDTKYGDKILELTKGRGVDIVLNSLTSNGYKEATLRASAKGARFVEMSKLNIWTQEEVQQLRPDVKYTAVDLSQSDWSEWTNLLNSLKSLLDQNVVKPIPFVRFDALDVREAVQYMQKAKHIGKVVCLLPELKNQCGEIRVETPMFSDKSTYLITGGLGGIGFVICQWMVEKGAKNILLAGRSQPNLQPKVLINKMVEKGANIIAVQLDVENFEHCKDLLERKIPQMGLPPIKGIMHAAGTLSDSLIVNQDWKNLTSTFKTKIDGTLNLHELTKSINLEHFVLFSSMAAILGAPGQCNHSAGNSFEDAFAHYRHSIGLPATTINWGQWGEVGIATEVDIPGIRTLSNAHGIASLEYVMKAHRTQTAVINVTSWVVLSKFYPHLATYLDERIWKKNVSANASITMKSNEFWQQYDSALEVNDKVNVIKEQLKNILRIILRVSETDIIGDDIDLQEMGVDSLMFVEIKNGLQTLLSDRLTVSAKTLKDCNTVSLISNSLVAQIEGAFDHEIEIKPALEEVNALIREDCLLPMHINITPGQNVMNIEDVQIVLLTGCTGTFGPYVLKELTCLPQIKQVICLMRPLRRTTPEERLKLVLNKTGLLNHVCMEKVRCVTGNVAKSNLGMESNIWEDLCEKVDAVFHCAASVSHIEHYRKRITENDMRAVNIGGTKNVLEFACLKKLKHVYHASSLLASTTIDDDGHVSESWPDMGEYDGLTTFAYPITKFVCDYLIKIGVERGIPCKVFRFPYIVGDSKIGLCSIDANHLLLRYVFVMKSGVIPLLPMHLPMLPVDVCADVSIRIFFEESSESGIYNIGHKNPSSDLEFVEVAKKFGHPVEIVEFLEFTRRIKMSKSESVPNFNLFQDLYKDEDAFMATYCSSPITKKWMESGDDLNTMWWSKKVLRLIPNFYETQRATMDYIYNDLLYCKSKGWFEMLGL